MSEQPQNTNGWPKWGMYVLKQLEHMDKSITDLAERVERLHDKQNHFEHRLGRIELMAKVIASIATPVAIWAVIELLKSLL